MRVAYLADLLYYRIAAGSTRYAGELIRYLGRVPGIELLPFSLYPEYFIAAMARERNYPVSRSVASGVPRQLRYVLWHLAGWAGAERRIMRQADVVHTPTFLVPPRNGRPLVVTVLDLSFLRFPEYHGGWWRTLAVQGLRRAVREADALIAISSHTADDLVHMTGVPSCRVHVVPLAADPRFRSVDDPAVPAKYGIDSPFLLYVGTLEPRKNLTVLLKAFADLPEPGLKLVLAGAKGWMYQELFQTVDRLGLGSRVIFPGFVPDADLPALLNSAVAFVYPSEYEGFGLPVLEAMSCGAPVITTDVSSLPEVAGSAALLVPPRDAVALRAALERVVASQDLRNELRAKGIEQAGKFSWSRTAEATAAVYGQVVR
jgi:glycosyltransferase involved in cell wall biosynthesis